MLEYKGIKIKWLGHDTFLLEKDFKIIIDPYKIPKPLEADMVLISHEHFDHMSIEDLGKVSSERTIIVAAKECVNKLTGVPFKEKISLSPGEEKIVHGIKICGVAAYNIDKINPDTKKPFHPKEDNKIGFLINIKGTTIYHTGDSDLVMEMSNLQPDVLLVPVSGTYVMTAREAARAVDAIKPKIAIPMHYGTIVGSQQDAQEFKNSVTSCEVYVPTKES
ncbi:MAG: MBL fold metallo-hydrolase [Thaumarchaeota archaeon]|nr:MBL fold metallo-hydrolase [Nitrososphaerota archaeon]